MNFSIIIPVYNAESYLDRCLQSVVNQTLPDYEVIIVNDGSTDHSEEIIFRYCSNYPDRFQFISQENRGLGAARNTGMKIGSGDYLFFLDADDYILPETLELAKQYLDRYDLDILGVGIRKCSPDDEEFNEINSKLISYYPWTERQFIAEANGPLAFFFKRGLFVVHQLFFPEGIWYEVHGLLPILGQHTDKIGKINARLYQYCQHEESIMHSDNTDRMMEIIDSSANYIRYFKDNGVFERYYEELEYRTVQHVLFDHIARLFNVGKEVEKAKQSLDYIREQFPSFRNNTRLKKRVKRNRAEALALQGKFEQLWNEFYTPPIIKAEQYLASHLDKTSVGNELMISVIIPVFNVEQYINDCLTSVIEALHDIPSEIILVNDGSSDRSPDICRMYADHFSFIHCIDQENRGVSAARNVGVNAAKGKYIAFVDSDDAVSVTMYSDMLQAAERDGSDFAICPVKRGYDLKSEKWFFEHTEKAFHNVSNGPIFCNVFMPSVVNDGYAWDKLIRRDFYLENRFSFPEGRLFEDMPVTMYMYSKAKCISVTRNGYYFYRIRRGTSKSILQMPLDQRVSAQIDSMKYTLNLLNNSPLATLSLKNKYLSDTINGWLSSSFIASLDHPGSFLSNLRDVISLYYNSEDLQRLNPVLQGKLNALMNEDDTVLKQYIDLSSCYRTMHVHTENGEALREVPEVTGKAGYNYTEFPNDPEMNLYELETEGEAAICHAYLMYPRITVTPDDYPMYQVWLENPDTLERIPLQTEAESRRDRQEITYTSQYDQTSRIYDCRGTGFRFVLNRKELFERIAIPGRNWLFLIEYSTPYYSGKTYLRGMPVTDRNIFYNYPAVMWLTWNPAALVSVKRSEFDPKEKISLVTPVYNAEQHLSRFFRCIHRQTYENLEVLILDDGSSDRTADLCEQYACRDDRIRVLRLPHGGVAKARNKALQEYTGKYLMFADADDLFSNNYVRRLRDLIVTSDVHLVTCIAHDTRNTALQNYNYTNKKKPQEFVWGKINYQNNVSHRVVWGAIYDRYAVEGIRFDEAYTVTTDTLFITEVTRKVGRYLHVNEELYCYILYPSSLSHRGPDRKKYDDIRVWMKIYEILPETGISHDSCQKLIIEKAKKMLDLIAAAEEPDMDLYRDICRDLKEFDMGPLVYKDFKARIMNRLFLNYPETYMKLRRKKNTQ